MKYFLIVLTILSLSACQTSIEEKRTTPVDTSSPHTQESTAPMKVESQKDDISYGNQSVSSDRDSLNSWKNFPWKREIAAKKDKNILDYFYLADTKLFCDSTSDDTDSQKAFDTQIDQTDLKNDYILARTSIGDELQFTRFRNTKGGEDIFVVNVNSGAGSMCNNFNVLKWNENEGWNIVETEDVFPQKEIDKFWKKQTKEILDIFYLLPEYGTTIEVYIIPFDLPEFPPLSTIPLKFKHIYSLIWDGEKFTFE